MRVRRGPTHYKSSYFKFKFRILSIYTILCKQSYCVCHVVTHKTIGVNKCSMRSVGGRGGGYVQLASCTTFTFQSWILMILLNNI